MNDVGATEIGADYEDTELEKVREVFDDKGVSTQWLVGWSVITGESIQIMTFYIYSLWNEIDLSHLSESYGGSFHEVQNFVKLRSAHLFCKKK